MYVGAQDKTGCYYNGDASKDHERNGISLNGMNRSHVTRNLKGKFSYAGCEIMKMRQTINYTADASKRIFLKGNPLGTLDSVITEGARGMWR